jgi:4-aminobutyrate aminotransferase
VNKDDILLADRDFIFPAVFHYYAEPLVVSRAKDQFVYDADGAEYLDFFAGILSISVGHCNDFVNARLHEQIDRLQHVSTVYVTEPAAKLAKKLASITPEGKLTRSLFTNSGTEANEAAIILARCYTGSKEIIALRHSYHGRSDLAMGITGHAAWKAGGAPQPGVVFAHNAYCYRCPFGLKYPDCEVRCARDVEDVIRTTTSGRVAGFIAEPIQGVGGFITPPREYFGIVASPVRQYGGVMISDEVQTAWGRTGGKWFGIEQYGVRPDLIVAAKSLGNGHPIGATLARAAVADAFTGMTIATFGGNPVTMAAAKAVVDAIAADRLMDNAASVGGHLRARLEGLAEKHAVIGEVRGMGLMQGVELVKDRKTKEPATQAAGAVLEAAKDRGLIIGKGGLYGNVLRISPALNVTRADADQAADVLDASFAAAGGA